MFGAGVDVDVGADTDCNGAGLVWLMLLLNASDQGQAVD